LKQGYFQPFQVLWNSYIVLDIFSLLFFTHIINIYNVKCC
jgi:hypothetical protein